LTAPTARTSRGATSLTRASQPVVTAVYAELIPQLAAMARSLVRDLDPQVCASARAAEASAAARSPDRCRVPFLSQNDLQFLRVRSKEHEIMVYAGARPARCTPEFVSVMTACICALLARWQTPPSRSSSSRTPQSA
jgi:hypothetical protein